jgi:hypothetical protein
MVDHKGSQVWQTDFQQNLEIRMKRSGHGGNELSSGFKDAEREGW